MSDAEVATIATRCLEAWTSGDFPTARTLLRDDVTATDPYGATDGAENYLDELRELAKMVTGADQRRVLVDGENVCVFYDLVTVDADDGSEHDLVPHQRRHDRFDPGLLRYPAHRLEQSPSFGGCARGPVQLSGLLLRRDGSGGVGEPVLRRCDRLPTGPESVQLTRARFGPGPDAGRWPRHRTRVSENRIRAASGSLLTASASRMSTAV